MEGIWEVRGEPKHFTASKVMCRVAAARGADLAEERGDDKRAQRWTPPPGALMAPPEVDGLDSPHLGDEAHPGVRSNGDVTVNAT